VLPHTTWRRDKPRCASMIQLTPCWPCSRTPMPQSQAILGHYINSALQIVPENFYTFRVDHSLSTHDTLFGTYLFDDTDYLQPTILTTFSFIPTPDGRRWHWKKATRSAPASSLRAIRV